MSRRIPVNSYGRQLTEEAIAAGEHRDFVGGMWDEIGPLQLAFMQRMGLAPRDRLLDVGCGALRGGIQFIRYLDRGNYYGFDINASLIEAGKRELAVAGLVDKSPHLRVGDAFEVGAFNASFGFAIAVSLFSHLPAKLIGACLANVKQVLAPRGRFYASYWEAPRSAHREPIVRDSGVVTHYDADSYHYSFAEMRSIAATAGIGVERIGDWGHPRGQLMLCFGNEA